MWLWMLTALLLTPQVSILKSSSPHVLIIILHILVWSCDMMSSLEPNHGPICVMWGLTHKIVFHAYYLYVYKSISHILPWSKAPWFQVISIGQWTWSWIQQQQWISILLLDFQQNGETDHQWGACTSSRPIWSMRWEWEACTLEIRFNEVSQG